MGVGKMDRLNILELESKGCFDFFWQEANTDKNSPGFGLIRDRAPGMPNMASIASVGYGLTALAIGTERKWVSFEDAYNLDVTPEWYGEDFIGIDKGISLLMIENYRTGFVWEVFMKNKYAKLGMEKCQVLKTVSEETKEQVAANIEN